MDNGLYVQTRNLEFNEIFSAYNHIKARAHNKVLVDRALSVLQRGYWRMTNYQTFLTWSPKESKFWAATKVGCTCPVWSIHHNWCKHMVARYIVLEAVKGRTQ